MSLLTFLQRPEIRKGFREAINKPAFKADRPILAPPLTQNYRIVGRAFDYLLRFYVEKTNPNAHKKAWIAELAPLLFRAKSEILKMYLDEAKQHKENYIQSGVMTNELISNAIRLAYMDSAYRSGQLDFVNLTKLDERDIEDLTALLSLVNETAFKSSIACYLNPSFSRASRLVQGADADILIDNRLIDIKTTKYLELKTEDIHQLVGYYILISLGGITSGKFSSLNYIEEVCEITELSIYFSRHGYLHIMTLAELISPEAMLEFTKWFIKSACPQENLFSCCKEFYGQAAKDIIKELK